MKRHILYIFLIFSVFACLLSTMALAASEDTDEEVTEISNKADLIALLNDTGTRSGTYRLTDDFTIDTNELRGAEGDYSFKGDLDGNGHTITVQVASAPTEGFAPLFDTLRGSSTPRQVWQRCTVSALLTKAP